jgi:hypothetical protein
MMACIVNDQVIIEVDKTSKPPYDFLVEAGVPVDEIKAPWKMEQADLHKISEFL